MKVRTVHCLTLLAMAAAVALMPQSAQASPIHRVRGQAAVLRSHTLALAAFLKAKCHCVPQLGAAHPHAEVLARRADALFDMTRCHTPIGRMQAELAAIECEYRVVNRMVRDAALHVPRYHVHHACHLLDLIDRKICELRANLAHLGPPVPLIYGRGLSAHGPVNGYHRSPAGYHRSPAGYHRSPNGYRRSPSARHRSTNTYHRSPNVNAHGRPHLEPHDQPHVDPHLRLQGRAREAYSSRAAHSNLRTNRQHGGSLQLRIGRMAFSF